MNRSFTNTGGSFAIRLTFVGRLHLAVRAVTFRGVRSDVLRERLRSLKRGKDSAKATPSQTGESEMPKLSFRGHISQKSLLREDKAPVVAR